MLCYCCLRAVRNFAGYASLAFLPALVSRGVFIEITNTSLTKGNHLTLEWTVITDAEGHFVGHTSEMDIAGGETKHFTDEITNLGFGLEGPFQVFGVGQSGTLVGNSYVGPGGSGLTALVTDSLADGAGPGDYQSYSVDCSSRAPNDDAKKTLWVVDDTTLTADLFREGIDKLKEGSGSGGGGGGMSLEDFATTNVESIAALQKYSYDHPKVAPTFDSDHTIAAERDAAVTTITEAMSARELPDYSSSAAGVSSPLTLVFPHDLGTIDLDPAHNAQVTALAAWMKTSIAWLIAALFGWWLWGWFREVYVVISSSVPAKGNPVVGGTGAQATSLILAGLITAVIVSAPTLFWAAADTATAWISTSGGLHPLESGSTPIQVGIYLLRFFFPVATFLAAVTSLLVIRKGGLVIMATAQTFVRWMAV